MKALLLLIAVLAIPSFAFSVHITEMQTNAGLMQYFTVRDGNKTCLLDYNKTTQMVMFSICFTK